MVRWHRHGCLSWERPDHPSIDRREDREIRPVHRPMAVIVRGTTQCRLCRQVIAEGDDVMAFSAFVPNTKDPLWRFSDAAMHRRCFEADPDARRASTRWEQTLEQTGPGHRECAVCGSEVLEPEDHFTLGHLTDDPSSPLFVYNYTHLHRSHLPGWADLKEVLALVEELSESETWGGGALRPVVEELRQFAW